MVALHNPVWQSVLADELRVDASALKTSRADSSYHRKKIFSIFPKLFLLGGRQARI